MTTREKRWQSFFWVGRRRRDERWQQDNNQTTQKLKKLNKIEKPKQLETPPHTNLFEKNRGKLVRCCQTLSHSFTGIRDPLASLQEPGKLRDNTQSKRHGEEKIREGKTLWCVVFIFLFFRLVTEGSTPRRAAPI